MEKVRKSRKDRVYFYCRCQVILFKHVKTNKWFWRRQAGWEGEEEVPGWDCSSLTLRPKRSHTGDFEIVKVSLFSTDK